MTRMRVNLIGWCVMQMLRRRPGDCDGKGPAMSVAQSAATITAAAGSPLSVQGASYRGKQGDRPNAAGAHGANGA